MTQMKCIPINTILQTEALRLRAVSLCDIELVWSASRIPGFNDGMVWEPPDNKEQLIPITEMNLRTWKEGKSFTFTIELVDTNIPVGRIVIRHEDKPSIWSIGYWIHPDHWNHGYATEAAQAIIEFGFEKLGASKIKTRHAAWNTQSKRVIEKLGFQFTGRNPHGFLKQGKPVSVCEYVIEAKTF